MDILERIDRLCSAITGEAGLEDADKWWAELEAIVAEIKSAPKASRRERELVLEAKDGLSAFTLALREGMPAPDPARARVPLTALANEIRKRAIGPDGWPLKRR
jgi:hypothetical protein